MSGSSEAGSFYDTDGVKNATSFAIHASDSRAQNMHHPSQAPGPAPGRRAPLTPAQRAQVADNLNIARWAVRNYIPTLRPGGPDFDDAVSVAFLGLVEAARRYDPGRASFMRYALYWCRAGLRRWWAARHRRGLRQVGRAARVVSLDRDLGGRRIAAGLRAPAADPGDRHDTEVVLRALSDLPNRHREAVDLTLLQGLTLAQAGRHLGVSGERVRQVREQAVRLVRERCGLARGGPVGEGQTIAGPDVARGTVTTADSAAEPAAAKRKGGSFARPDGYDPARALRQCRAANGASGTGATGQGSRLAPRSDRSG
jgi:RNA polymerase sigma factor (sigma-70 family)